MIRPAAGRGVAFSDDTDGDLRHDEQARSEASALLGISSDWATVRQVHGSEAMRVHEPGDAGEADALWTTVAGLPLAVFTADCFGVVLVSSQAIGVAHAGWRGAEAGVAANLRAEMTAGGHEPTEAYTGPGIGPCCFEVGPEVSVRFPEQAAMTSWGTGSVDLRSAIVHQLGGMATQALDACTHHEEGWYSHRRDGTKARLATIGWVA